MKIALVHNLPDGGAKRALFEHARHLRLRGHTLDAFLPETAREAFLPLAPLCQNVRTYPMPHGPAIDKALIDRLLWHPATRLAWRTVGEHRRNLWACDRAAERRRRFLDAVDAAYLPIARDIDAGGYDWVYVHHCRFLLSPHLLVALHNTPTVYYCQDTLRHVHEWAPQTPTDYDAVAPPDGFVAQRGRWYSPGEWTLTNEEERRNAEYARAADLVLANSFYSQEALTRAYGLASRVCYLGVDSGFFCPDTIPEKKREVLSVGALGPMKRHDFILEAVATIPAARRPSLRIIGYSPTHFGAGGLGTYAETLLARAKQTGVELFIDEGCDDAHLRTCYRQAGVVAFAPRLEPFGFVPLEAMACQTPIVGVCEGGLRESIENNVTGFSTERDPHAFGEALDRVLTDSTLAERVGRAGRETVCARWCWESSTDRLETLVSDFFHRRQGGAA